MNLVDIHASNIRALRGDKAQDAFARKPGINQATLARLESGAQNTTIKTPQADL